MSRAAKQAKELPPVEVPDVGSPTGYTRLVDALKEGPTQPWQRTDDGTSNPEVGRSACLGCMARKIRREVRHLKPYPHTCLEGVKR